MMAFAISGGDCRLGGMLSSAYWRRQIRLRVLLTNFILMMLIVLALAYLQNLICSTINGGERSESPLWTDALTAPVFYLVVCVLHLVIVTLSWPLRTLNEQFYKPKKLLLTVLLIAGIYFYTISYALESGYWTGAGDYFHPHGGYIRTGGLLIIYAIWNIGGLILTQTRSQSQRAQDL